MKQELKSAFFGRGFLTAFFVMFFCFLAYTMLGYIASLDWGPGFPSAFQLVIGSIFFGGVILVFPISVTMAYADTQVDEIRSAFVYWKAMRSSVLRISLNKAVASALSGAAACTLAFILHVVIWNLVAVPFDPVAFPNQSIYFTEGVFYQAWSEIHYALPVYVSMSFGMFLTGMVWGVIALAVGVWLPDKLTTITVTTGIYFLWMYNFSFWLFGIHTPPPNALFNDGLTVQELTKSLSHNAVALVVSSIVYYAGMKRRLQNA